MIFAFKYLQVAVECLALDFDVLLLLKVGYDALQRSNGTEVVDDVVTRLVKHRDVLHLDPTTDAPLEYLLDYR